MRARHWLEGKKPGGGHDVLWLRPDGTEMREEDWHFPEGRFVAYVLAPLSHDGEALLLAFNATPDEIEVTFPPWPNVARWTRVLDSRSGSVPRPPR